MTAPAPRGLTINGMPRLAWMRESRRRQARVCIRTAGRGKGLRVVPRLSWVWKFYREMGL